MNNIELEQAILEIISEDNYFEMITKAMAFEKEYKTTDFYKNTKKPLMEVIKETKVFYALQLKDLGRYLQDILDTLSLENLNAIIDKASEILAKENSDIQDSLELFKDLKDKFNN